MITAPDQPPFVPLDLYPADSPAYMVDAWAGCLSWASGEPEILRQFSADTGVTVARDPLSLMIDRQTGYDAQIARRFVEWFNANVWGPVG